MGVLYFGIYATMTCVFQSYFIYRLLTVNALWFEVSKAFYENPIIVRSRHNAVKRLGYALLLLPTAAGGMLYIKFARDGESRISLTKATTTYVPPSTCAYALPNPLGLIVLAAFTGCSWSLYRLMRSHRQCFESVYDSRHDPSMSSQGEFAMEVAHQRFHTSQQRWNLFSRLGA